MKIIKIGIIGKSNVSENDMPLYSTGVSFVVKTVEEYMKVLNGDVQFEFVLIPENTQINDIIRKKYKETHHEVSRQSFIDAIDCLVQIDNDESNDAIFSEFKERYPNKPAINEVAFHKVKPHSFSNEFYS